MIMLVAFGLLIVTVLLAGGDPRKLAHLELRAGWIVALALGLQVVVISIVPNGSEGLNKGLHIASYVLVGGFIVANRHIPGLWLIGLGAVLNFTAIVANGGVMPASESALERAGRDAGDEFENSAAVEDARLEFLGDVFAIPEAWPASNVFSVGDVLIVIGAGVGLHRASESRLGRLGGRPAVTPTN